MLEMAEESGINKLGEHIYDLFLAELQQKRFQSFDSDPIGADETPEEIANTFRLEIPNHFFTRGVHGYALPKIFKRTKKEEELTYEYRIRNRKHSRIGYVDSIFSMFKLSNPVSASNGRTLCTLVAIFPNG